MGQRIRCKFLFFIDHPCLKIRSLSKHFSTGFQLSWGSRFPDRIQSRSLLSDGDPVCQHYERPKFAQQWRNGGQLWSPHLLHTRRAQKRCRRHVHWHGTKLAPHYSTRTRDCSVGRTLRWRVHKASVPKARHQYICGYDENASDWEASPAETCKLSGIVWTSSS